MEKSTALQTNKSKENLAPPNQLYNKCFSRQETQEKEKAYKLKTIKKMPVGTYIAIITLRRSHKQDEKTAVRMGENNCK